MLLPSVWVFPPYILTHDPFRRRTGRTGLAWYILDPMEERLGPWLGNLVLGVVWTCWHFPVIFCSGLQPNVYTFCRIYAAYGRLFLVLRLGATVSGKRTLAGLVAHGLPMRLFLFSYAGDGQGAGQPRFWIWASLTFVIGLVTMVLRSRQSSLNTSKAAEHPTGASALILELRQFLLTQSPLSGEVFL